MMGIRQTVRKSRALAFVVVVALLTWGCGTAATSVQPSATQPAATSQPSVAASPSEEPALDTLYAAAKAEGKLIVLGAADPEYMSKLFTAFASSYPDIETTFIQHSPPDALQLLVTNAAAGTSVADVVLMKYQQIAPFYEEGVRTDTDWASLGVPTNVVMPISGGVVEQAPAVGLAYNSDLVDPADLPKTWEELIDPKWKGVLSIDSNGSPWDLISPTWGKDQTVDYVSRLIDVVDPVAIGGSTNGLMSLISGETHVRPAQYEAVLELKTDGAPLGWAPLDPIVLDKTAWWLLDDGTSPNAGQLFMAWQSTSPEAQNIGREYFRPNGGMNAAEEFPAGFDVVAPASVEDYDLSAEVKALLEPILAGLGG